MKREVLKVSDLGALAPKSRTYYLRMTTLFSWRDHMIIWRLLEISFSATSKPLGNGSTCKINLSSLVKDVLRIKRPC